MKLSLRAASTFLTALAITQLTTQLAFAGGGMRPEVAEHGMVASVHELASRAGVEIMQAGGNAIDAAVATGFALAVVWPQAGNLGGGGFMLIRMKDGTTHFVDFREKAPGKASANMYQDAQGNVIPNLSTIGYKAVGVPGSVKGLVYAEEHFGKLGLKRVMEPAIRLAREGYALSWSYARFMSEEKAMPQFADSKRIFQNDGKGWHQNDIFKQPELARTLERIATAPDDFYTGKMAHELADFIQQGGGLITAADLAHYEVKDRTPVRGTYRGLEVISAPPPSSGGIALIETLNILEGYDLGKAGLDSAESIHLITEAYRRAFYDRAQFLGDPEFSDVPVLQLTDKSYAVAWRSSIQPLQATSSRTLQRPPTSTALARYVAAHPVVAPVKESTQTTHYSVVDADGNAVAVTTTLNVYFGSRVTIGSLGFLLNDEMDDFSSKPGAPNVFGLIQGDANAVGPGKRPLSAMAPTIVLKDDKLFLVMGSPGGPRIISTVANIFMGVVDYGMNIQEAVNAARFHQQWLPDVAYLEEGFSPDAVKALEGMGYHIEFGVRGEETWDPYWSDGECIMIDLKSGERLGASDKRHNGRAVGF